MHWWSRLEFRLRTRTKHLSQAIPSSRTIPKTSQNKFPNYPENFCFDNTPGRFFEGPARSGGGLWIGTDVRELPPLPSFLVLFERIMAHSRGQWLMSIWSIFFECSRNFFASNQFVFRSRAAMVGMAAFGSCPLAGYPLRAVALRLRVLHLSCHQRLFVERDGVGVFFWEPLQDHTWFVYWKLKSVCQRWELKDLWFSHPKGLPLS